MCVTIWVYDKKNGERKVTMITLHVQSKEGYFRLLKLQRSGTSGFCCGILRIRTFIWRAVKCWLPGTSFPSFWISFVAFICACKKITKNCIRKQRTKKPFIQSINPPINQSIHRSINPPINQSINRPLLKPSNQIDRSNDQSINWPNDQSTHVYGLSLETFQWRILVFRYITKHRSVNRSGHLSVSLIHR